MPNEVLRRVTTLAAVVTHRFHCGSAGAPHKYESIDNVP